MICLFLTTKYRYKYRAISSLVECVAIVSSEWEFYIFSDFSSERNMVSFLDVEVRGNLDKYGEFSFFFRNIICRYIVDIVDDEAIGIASLCGEHSRINSPNDGLFFLEEMNFFLEKYDIFECFLIRVVSISPSEHIGNNSSKR